jgi:hypothetical protein
MSKATGVGLISIGVAAVAMGASGGLAAIPALVGVLQVAVSDRNERDKDKRRANEVGE